MKRWINSTLLCCAGLLVIAASLCVIAAQYIIDWVSRLRIRETLRKLREDLRGSHRR